MLTQRLRSLVDRDRPDRVRGEVGVYLHCRTCGEPTPLTDDVHRAVVDDGHPVVCHRCGARIGRRWT